MSAGIHAVSRKCRLSVNALGRWVLMHPHADTLGWSGNCWVEMVEGIGLLVHVSNFETREQAAHYARENGFVAL